VSNTFTYIGLQLSLRQWSFNTVRLGWG